jgi:hypothetical protein
MIGRGQPIFSVQAKQLRGDRAVSGASHFACDTIDTTK